MTNLAYQGSVLSRLGRGYYSIQRVSFEKYGKGIIFLSNGVVCPDREFHISEVTNLKP